jgi:hypothetical protein
MDPLSLTASIIGVLTFAIDVATAIDSFITVYRTTDSELEAIVKEVNALRSVLESLRNAYQRANRTRSASGLSMLKNVFMRQRNSVRGHGDGHGQTDKALESTLDGLEESLKQLVDVVTKSQGRMAKGGLYKVYVQTLWQRTATGIEKALPPASNIFLRRRSAIHCLAIK